jgi:hypothetical protein
MTAAPDGLDRDVDVGRAGISGFYSHMTTLVRSATPRAILSIGIWLVVLKLPASLDYRPVPDISLAFVAKALLILWTAKLWWPLFQSLYYGAKWLGLEAMGIKWVTRNDHALRVTYYRIADGSIQFDDSTRANRLNQELQAAQYRRHTLLTNAIQIVSLAVAYIVVPLGLAYLDEFLNADVRNFLDGWNAVGVIRWFIFYLGIVPPLVYFALALFESFVYASGAQYIPGAKLTDPVIREKTLETMREEQTHGAADFVDPDDAARQMAK